MKLYPRESVIFADDFHALIAWYQNVLGFKQTYLVEDEYHYCTLENENGICLGIASATEMDIIPDNRKNNTVVLQFQVTDVPDFFDHLKERGGTVTFGPSFDKKGGFWFGGFQDLEGNPFWVVDENCP